MASFSRVPDAYGLYDPEGTSAPSWSTLGVASSSMLVLTSYGLIIGDVGYIGPMDGCYMVGVGTPGAVVSACSLDVTFDLPESSVVPATFRCSLYVGHDPRITANFIASQNYTVSSTGPQSPHRFSFSGLNATVPDTTYGSVKAPICFVVECLTSAAAGGFMTAPTASVTYTLPTLSVAAAPSALDIGGTVALSFENRLDQRLNVKFKYSSTELLETNVSADSVSVTCPASWFETAGVTGTSMRVDVSVTDGIGRTASANFTLNRPALSLGVTPSTVTIGNNVTLTFSNRLGNTVSLQFKYSSTLLATASASSDSLSVNCPASWFDTAGVTAATMRVDVTATDSAGRTATTNFTLAKPTLSMGVTPSSVPFDGSVTLSFANRLGKSLSVVFKYNTTQLLATQVNADTTTLTCPASWFGTAGVTGNNMSVSVTATDNLNRSASASFTLTKPTLSVAASPAFLNVGGSVTLSFTNRKSRPLTLVLRSGSTQLASFSVSADSKSVTCPESWFSTAGVSGSSMTVTAEISDDLNRSATTTFTLNNPQPLSVTATAPKSTTVEGSNAITFSWTVSGDWGTQTKAELQWSTDNANWETLATVSGSGTTWSAPAAKFPVGTVYWRVRVTNTYNKVSAWSTASFTVRYASFGVTATPATVYVGNSVSLAFSDRQGQTLSVLLRNGNTELYSTTAAGNLSVSCPASWFETAGVTASSMVVTVAVSDELGRSATTTFTLVNPQGSTVTLTAPKNSTAEGSNTITFAWSVSTDWGTQTKAELQWSDDNANWTDLATVSGDAKTWTAPAVKFPAGTIYWRARVTNSYGVVGEWAAAVHFTVSYAAISQAVPVNSPTSGTINASLTRVFQIALEASGPVYTPFTVASASFFWRSGTSGDYTELAMTAAGNGASVTIAGGTFPSGTVQWYASATDNTGRTTQTAVFTLSTLSAAVEAVPLSPINTVESGNGPIVFRWSYGSVDGSAQIQAQIRTSSDGSSWGDPVIIPGRVTTYEAPAGSFEAGTVYWQVRSKNQAGTLGSWSDAVSFICFSAPHVTGVSADGKPFCTITWQVTGQLAYEISVDGKIYGPYFGENDRSFTLTEPLENGLHEIRVRAQNRYGLWSEWAEGAAEITNVPGPSLTGAIRGDDNIELIFLVSTIAPCITRQPPDIRASGGTIRFAVLATGGSLSYQWQMRSPTGTWNDMSGSTTYQITVGAIQAADGYQYRCKVYNGVGEIYSEPGTFTYGSPTQADVPPDTEVYAPTGYFLVYRDGKLIGKTYRSSFVDRAAVGPHVYTAIQVLANGYYTRMTNSKAFDLKVKSPMIAPLSGGDFQKLRLSESAHRKQQFSSAVETAYVRYAGARYPEAEVGAQRSLSGSYDVAFTHADQASAAAFEALIGEAVILKSPGGALIVGVLDAFERTDSRFFKSYTFRVQQMNWRDFVDA